MFQDFGYHRYIQIAHCRCLICSARGTAEAVTGYAAAVEVAGGIAAAVARAVAAVEVAGGAEAVVTEGSAYAVAGCSASAVA